MKQICKAALVQITAGTNPAENISFNIDCVRQAADGGADFVLFPEVCNMIEPDRAALRAKAQTTDEDETLAAFRDAARANSVWILVGSIVVVSDDAPGKLANRSFLIDDTGHIRATYDKMHLFDVDVGAGDVYRESDTYRAGNAPCLADSPWGLIGLTVCYDLRFPHLYRDLAKAGARILTVPSAFTRPTGQAHWHVLLRARAIECGAFVLAPAQTGEHAGGRKTYGHSLAVGPWGEVLADGEEEKGITIVEMDMVQCAEARRRIPALRHDKRYAIDEKRA